MQFEDDDTKVYLMRLPAQVHANLMRAQAKTNLQQDDHDLGIEVGEIRIDPETKQSTFLMRKDIDEDGRRWAMSMDIEPVNKTFGIITQKKKATEMKLTTMIDARVTCLAKNYKVDERVKQIMLNDVNKKTVLEIDAPPLD